MINWPVYLRIAGDDYLHTFKTSVPVSDDIYRKMIIAADLRKPFSSCEFYETVKEKMNSILKKGQTADETVLSSAVICDPGDIKRLREKFRGRTYGWYADKTANECEFDYYSPEYPFEEYCLTVCFDKNGTVTDIKDVIAFCPEIRNGIETGKAECYPEFVSISLCLENELEKTG